MSVKKVKRSINTTNSSKQKSAFLLLHVKRQISENPKSKKSEVVWDPEILGLYANDDMVHEAAYALIGKYNSKHNFTKPDTIEHEYENGSGFEIRQGDRAYELQMLEYQIQSSTKGIDKAVKGDDNVKGHGKQAELDESDEEEEKDDTLTRYEKTILEGRRVLVTGTLTESGMKRGDVTNYIEANGGEITTKLADAHFIVLGDKPGRKKLDQIAENGWKTMPEEDFVKMMLGTGDYSNFMNKADGIAKGKNDMKGKDYAEDEDINERDEIVVDMQKGKRKGSFMKDEGRSNKKEKK